MMHRGEIESAQSTHKIIDVLFELLDTQRTANDAELALARNRQALGRQSALTLAHA